MGFSFLNIIYIIFRTFWLLKVNFILLTDWKDAVRAMSILGMIALLISVVMTTLKLFAMKESKIPQFVAIGTVFAGGKM